MSNATTKQYRNPHNGGQERVSLRNGKFYISSDWGSGFCAESQVSASDLRRTMAYTSAPADVVEAMLGAAK